MCLVTEDEGTLVLGTQFLTLNTASHPLLRICHLVLSHIFQGTIPGSR